MSDFVALSAALLLVGAITIAWAINSRRMDGIRRAWPKTPGSIVEAAIAEKRRKSRQNGSVRYYTVYEPTLSYLYIVDGKEYQGRRIGPVRHTMDKATAEAVLGKYGAGSTVDVIYNPQNPGDAFLEPSSPEATLFLAILGGLFVASAVIVGVVQFL